MTIHSTGERERLVRSLVVGGCYASVDDVIGKALRLLEERDEQARIDELRCQVGVGIEQADRSELATFDPHATVARVRARRTSAGNA